MDEDTINVEIEWPEMVVSFSLFELTYDLDDILEITGEGDAHVLEVTEYGLVIEYDGSETEFIDMRPLSENTNMSSEESDD